MIGPLFTGTMLSAVPPLAEWPADLRYRYEERAGIKEDSGMERAQAEAQALQEMWERRNRWNF